MAVWVSVLLVSLTVATRLVWAANLNMRDITSNDIQGGGGMRNSDPLQDVAAITSIHPSAVLNLPLASPLNVGKDIPGPPLTPTEFEYELPVADFSPNTSLVTDPIELAGAFEGDILLSDLQELHQMTQVHNPSGEIMTAPAQRNAVIQPDRVWPNKEIPYVISSTYEKEERGTIAVAMSKFHLNTCIKFVPRTTHRDYIHIYKGDGCSSSVGRVSGHQAVSLGRGCLYVGIVMHELMHAAGFWHEQSRFDRDDYIRIYWSNIKNGMEYNFQKYDWKTISHLDMIYDLGSIMHYGPKSFAKNPKRKTIEAINGEEIGQRREFSNLDVQKIRKLYKCDDSTVNKVTTNKPSTGGPTTSGASTCRDTYDTDKCKSWSATGECHKNPDWMLVNCQKSCDSCIVVCKDHNTNCAYWAKKQECTTNTAYMHLYCKQSCGLCHAPNDFTNDCVDQNKYCEEWAASGTCHTKTDYMVTYCKKSCTDCRPSIQSEPPMP